MCSDDMNWIPKASWNQGQWIKICLLRGFSVKILNNCMNEWKLKLNSWNDEKKIVSQRTIFLIDYLDILLRRTEDCDTYYTG